MGYFHKTATKVLPVFAKMMELSFIDVRDEQLIQTILGYLLNNQNKEQKLSVDIFSRTCICDKA